MRFRNAFCVLDKRKLRLNSSHSKKTEGNLNATRQAARFSQVFIPSCNSAQEMSCSGVLLHGYNST